MRERGSAAVELTLLTPLLIVLALLVIAFGRLAAARLETVDVAHQAARSASIARTAGEARLDARSIEVGPRCHSPEISVNVGSFRPGGSVTATVTCAVNLSDLSLLRVPGAHRISASFTSPIDHWRSNP